MANQRKVWGQTRVRIDGKEYATEGKSSLEIGGVKREAVAADHRAGYFMESTEPGKMEVNLLVTAGISLSALQAMDDANVTFEADTGQTYVMDGGYVSDMISVSDGKAKVTFMGEVQEVRV